MEDTPVQPHILRRVTGPDTELVGTVRDGHRKILLLCLTREEAERCAPAYTGLEPVPMNLRDIEVVCEHHGLSLIGLCELEPKTLSVISAEVLPLVLTRESDASNL
jgi:hypothetical protein